MRVRSTRGGDLVPVSVAVARGLAPDGGLYLPDRLPEVDAGAVKGLRALTAVPDRVGRPEALAATARAFLRPFFEDPADEALARALPGLVEEAFAFPIPMVPLGADRNAALLELFHGPTAAFKDFAARFLAGALAVLSPDGAGGRESHVLVATSGDTGSAVAAAFAGREGFRVSVLFPEGGVSPRQAHLLGCFEGAGNVESYRVAGDFDDAQRLVKEALSDPEIVRRHGLTSANSISLGRLLPQMTWFAHAALAWEMRTGTRPGFIVPSGNLGHGLAALWAREMGAPVGRIHLATNRNRALVDWVETGRAEPRPALRTPANAMDVGVPSNLERLRFHHPDPGPLARGGAWGLGPGLTAAAIPDEALLETLARAPERWGALVCPHTACALHALEGFREAGDRGPWIVAATAHPAKFPEVVEPRIGRPVPVPPALEELLRRPAHSEALAPELGALEEALDRA